MNKFAHLPDNPECNYFVENAALCPPRLTDIGPKSKNRCVTLRRRDKWKGYALLPDEAFYPKGVPEEPPVETDPHRARSKRNYYARAFPKPTSGRTRRRTADIGRGMRTESTQVAARNTPPTVRSERNRRHASEKAGCRERTW